MKTASIMAIFLINVFMSKKWPGVGPGIGRHPALGGAPERRHLGVGGRPPSLGDGMLITGGYGTRVSRLVEAYKTHIKKICRLPDLPFVVYNHTLCGGLLCYEKTCLKLGPLGFVKATVSLQKFRTFHLCWNLPEGVLLLGGSSSPSTTELVLLDGSASVSKFGLSYPAK